MSQERNAYYRKWRKDNRAYVALKAAERRSKKRGFKFNLKMEDLPKVPSKCPVFDRRFVYGRVSPYNLSLDRINSRRGYVRGNVYWLSRRANAAKLDLTPAELWRLASVASMIEFKVTL